MENESSFFGENLGNEIRAEKAAAVELLNEYGATCLAYKVKMQGKWLVLKRIKSEHTNNPIVQKCFDKEFEIGFGLDHPHIIKYINKGVDKEGAYILMEYVEGKTLRQHLSSSTVFSKEQIHTMVTQLFETVAYLHKKNIFHLDLKPENIIISDKTGNIKLIDFGFSYSDGQVPLHAGTKKYVLPEQNLQTKNVSLKNDLYSLGVIIIELYTHKTDLSGINKIPGNYKKVTKQCVDVNAENYFTVEEALLILNRKTNNTLYYYI